MKAMLARQRACQEALLVGLCNELVEREVPAAFVIEEDGRPGVDVRDCSGRTRRVYLHLEFRWFYWGDRPDERVSCLQFPDAVDRVWRAAVEGWHEGEQGELAFSLGRLAEAYRV
ncbi:hypothetical protein AB0L05_35745 [Nonomuraea pusilla]|uniref:hypothetical protein n=1 Tax=Nonomuraea pusilla TaxID=46177 RepID=UPI003323A68D